MQVRIIKHLPRQLEGIDVARFELGGVYEAGGAVLDLLIISGYAIPADDVTSRVEPDGRSSKQMLRKDRPRPSRALRGRRPAKRQK